MMNGQRPRMKKVNFVLVLEVVKFFPLHIQVLP